MTLPRPKDFSSRIRTRTRTRTYVASTWTTTRTRPWRIRTRTMTWVARTWTTTRTWPSRTKTRTNISAYHVLEVLILVGKFLLERRVQSTDDKVTVVLVLHQLLDATLFQEADASALQHRRRHVLQELLVVTGSTPKQFIHDTWALVETRFSNSWSWSFVSFSVIKLALVNEDEYL